MTGIQELAPPAHGDILKGSPPACRNCSTPLAGPFCAQCGQPDLPPDPTLGELLGEAWDTFVSVDGKVLASVRLLLLRPGALTREYLTGHRARYLPPLRLYLVCSVLFFLVSAAIPDHAPRGNGVVVGHSDEPALERARRDSLKRISTDSSRRAALASAGRAVPTGAMDSATTAFADSVRLERTIARELGPNPGTVRRLVLTRFIRNGERVSRDKKDFGRDLKEQLPRMMFVLMPAFAVLLAITYRSRRRRFPSHLIVSLHLHAFSFAALSLGAAIGALPLSPWRSAGITAVALWMIAYIPLALRSVYGGRLVPAVLRSATLAGVYLFVGTVLVTLLTLLLIVFY